MIKPEQKRLFGVIGNPVKHSLSPAMMNAAFASLEYPAVYVALQSDDFGEDLQILHRMGIGGLSVTLPFKELAYRFAVVVDDTARMIGAVNTLRRTRQGWQGCNTDWVGASQALSRATSLEGKRALILGAGGAARAVAFGLINAGAALTVSNRGGGRGEALAETFGCEFVPLARLYDVQGDFEVVVQCTSVGLDPGLRGAATRLVPDSFFRPGMVVMDIVYRPRRTQFVQAAEEAGCTVVSGLDMLLYQGVAQLEWWLGQPVPEVPAVAAMRRALEEAMAGEQND